MSEELFQRDFIQNPEKIGKWHFYNIGSTSVKNLKPLGLIRDVHYGDEERKKVDALIVQNKKVIAIIEYKKPSAFQTEAQKNKAIEQEWEVAKKLNAPLIIATDTKKTVWVHVLTGNRIKDENGNFIKKNFHPKDEKMPDFREKILYSVNAFSDPIKPKKFVNPTDFAKPIWQDIGSVSGATPENGLYTFVELFIFKYLSDFGILQGFLNFNRLYQNYEVNTEKNILETDVHTIRPKIMELFPKNPIDKTTIINVNGTIFVGKDPKAMPNSSPVFKKGRKRFKDYGELKHIDYDFKSPLFESFRKVGIRKIGGHSWHPGKL